MIHPMHLRGMPRTVTARHRWERPAPRECDKPGTRAFHCHIPPHAEGGHGMVGVVTATVVQDPHAPAAA